MTSRRFLTVGYILEAQNQILSRVKVIIKKTFNTSTVGGVSKYLLFFVLSVILSTTWIMVSGLYLAKIRVKVIIKKTFNTSTSRGVSKYLLFSVLSVILSTTWTMVSGPYLAKIRKYDNHFGRREDHGGIFIDVFKSI